MRFVADVHLHSRYSRATSRDLCPESLHRWASLKGLALVGTGDFTHPEWLAELQEKLVPAEGGLFRLREDLCRTVDDDLPDSCRGDVRFVLSTEISLIYKKGDRTRKVHHLILMPDVDSVLRLNQRLSAIGNITSDGRPILGIDSRDLVGMAMEASERSLFIPAHIWTPHFAALGSRSGFDSLEECFEDMLPNIFAVETGLSSDPPMNWRLSMLERFAIVSNSDAHSAPKLAREATCFDTELSYSGVYDALKANDSRLQGTIEFYPEEGKYHWDGHRKCDVCWNPAQTRASEGVCPVCEKALTVGVLHRVETLADRPEGTRPATAKPFESLIPLTEIVGSAVGVGPGSKRVLQIYNRLLDCIGPELHILRHAEIEEIAESGGPVVAEGVRRMREGEVHVFPGYDGEYGRIEVFDPDDRKRWAGQEALFVVPGNAGRGSNGKGSKQGANGALPAEGDVKKKANGTSPAEISGAAGDPGLDPSQQAVCETVGPVIVDAGPGTGKTRVLTHRVAHLVRRMSIPASVVSAVTFTNRAADEMRERIGALLTEDESAGLFVGTFHRMALDFHSGPDIALRDLIDEGEAHQALVDALRDADLSLSPTQARRIIGLAKANGLGPEDVSHPDARTAYAAYEQRLRVLGVRDFDDVLIEFRDYLLGDDDVLLEVRQRCRHLLVDEFQDLNAVQYEIVRLLAGDGEGLFVIGDPNQSIYGFRGSRPDFFQLVQEEVVGARPMALETTYRSTPEIVSASSALLRSRAATAVRPAGEPIRFLKTQGETSEGLAVVGEIMKRVGGGDMLEAHGRHATDGPARSFSDFGVLFRTGRQIEAAEAALRKEGLPYRIVGQKTFLDSPSVRHLLEFLRFAHRPHGGRRFLRVLALPGYAPAEGIPPAVRAHPPALPEPDLLPADLRPAAERLVADAARCKEAMANVEADVLISERAAVLGVSGEPAVEQLVRAGEAMGRVPKLLDAVLMGRDADVEIAGVGLRSRPEAITLMTLHASKGLEFPVVFICGVEEGLLPLSGLDGTPAEGDDLEEERRLFYVGITRARDEVVLLSSTRRVRHGKVLRPEPSRFLNEIPEGLLEKEDVVSSQKARQLSLF